MKLINTSIIITSLFTLIAANCGDDGIDGYSCKKSGNSVGDNYKQTMKCCGAAGESVSRSDLKKGDLFTTGSDHCYCSPWAAYYCAPTTDDGIKNFKDCCYDAGSDWYWDEC